MAELKRRLRRIDGLAIALGTVIGIGLFRNTGNVLRGTGGFTGATLLWVIGGVIVLGGAAFAYGWLQAGVVIPARQASTATITGELLAGWFPLSARMLALMVYLTLAALHLFGVRAGAMAQRVFTTGKLGIIAFVIAMAVALGLAGAQPEHESIAPVTFGLALGGVWYTYLGWQDTVLQTPPS